MNTKERWDNSHLEMTEEGQESPPGRVLTSRAGLTCTQDFSKKHKVRGSPSRGESPCQGLQDRRTMVATCRAERTLVRGTNT